MTLRFAVNGFGRIGRLVLRASVERPQSNLLCVGVNGVQSPELAAHLLAHDSSHGSPPFRVSHKHNNLLINDLQIPVTPHRNPQDSPWKSLKPHVVMECSGTAKTRELAEPHLLAGAPRILVSANCKNADAVVVFGVNHESIPKNAQVISAASCTTNCLAPVLHTLHKLSPVQRAYMTTIHAVTADQRLVDGSHKDPRRARAANLSLIPTTTGAASSISDVIPELHGKIHGSSIRAPVHNVSLVDLVAHVDDNLSPDDVNNAFLHASQNHLRGVLDVSSKPLVSCDFNHNPHSAVVDALETYAHNRLVRVLAWYDNEWGFANRMLDVAQLLAP